MRVVVQKCSFSSVSIEGKVFNKIDKGLNVLVGFTHDDTIEDLKYIVKKIIHLRIFEDEKGVMNKSVLDVGGEILSISQFTLYGDTKKGNRPSYMMALGGEKAKPLYEEFNNMLGQYVKTYSGVFGEDMKVVIHNEGPTTIIIDSK